MQSDASAMQNAPTGSLDSAWSNFESVSDAAAGVQQAGQQLESASQSTQSSLDCTS